MADVIAVAGGCSQADWTTSCIDEHRAVGVVFDHIAELNPEVVRWVQKFFNGRPVEMTHVYEQSPGRNNNARSPAACSDLRAFMRGCAYLAILALPVAGAVHRQFVHIVRKQPPAGAVQPKRSRHGGPGDAPSAAPRRVPLPS